MRFTSLRRLDSAGIVLSAALAAAAASCHRHGGSDAGTDAGAVAITAGPAAVSDAGPAAKDAPRIYAKVQIAPVFSATEWPPKDPDKAEPERRGVTRLGYFRDGESVAIKSGPIKKSNCPDGWYELFEGGYVCGKFVTQDPNDPALANGNGLHPPLEDGPLPYEYGLNLTNGTPLYDRIPTRKERERFEKHLLVGRSHPGDLERAQQAAETDDGNVPWYLQDHKGQRPMVTFDDMKGDHEPVLLRMVRGFYLAIDREQKTHWGKFWKTTGQDFVPEEHILVHKFVTDFKGVNLADPSETRKLPLAWMLNPHGWKYQLDEATQKVHRKDHLDRFGVVELTGKEVTIDFRVYRETKDGFWLKDVESTFTKPGPPPKDLAPGEKWIDVNLTTQTLVAFEGAKPVYATLVSTGRHDDKDPSKDHRTRPGEFRIREKHIAATMDDDSAADGPYSIQDVPWIMYFHGSIALHGAFWHSRFGRERSHGCVNLEPYDAKNLFNWAGPRLPDGWHGVRATDANPGTRVIVHE